MRNHDLVLGIATPKPGAVSASRLCGTPCKVCKVTRIQKIFARDLLRRRRELRGTTQAELADALGISAGYLSQMEEDQRPTTGKLLMRLSRLLGIGSIYFAADDDLRLASELSETANDPLLGSASRPTRRAQKSESLPRLRSACARVEHRSLQTRVAQNDPGAASRFSYHEVRIGLNGSELFRRA
ncbi:helix-turn-helix domain-containing protein [Bradyrhizobium yuanmingense]|uniref:helix-turn-helix domain-containing protein n=1 Tax=Bradyrhizobium yuanmingense TaxID=108015 RepID=UPI003D2F1F59